MGESKSDRSWNVFERVYASLSERLGRSLFEEMTRTESLKPGLTLSKLAAFPLAGLVHGLTLAFVILGGVLLVKGWPNLLAVLLAAVCLAIAWVLRPRFTKVPDDILPTEAFPTLYNVTGKIAGALGTSNVDGIVIGGWFNAAFTHAGWQRKRILYLGLPLFSVLTPQEKVALLAHELAHDVNGDPVRGFFIGSAIHTLVTWYELLRPQQQLWVPGAGFPGIAPLIANIVMSVLSRVPLLGVYALSFLLWRDSQRAEYLADYLAATVSGTEAMVSMLDKFRFEDTFHHLVHQISLQQREGKRDLFEELKREVAQVPPRKLEPIKRQTQIEKPRLDATHPPTAYRIEFLLAHPVREPKVSLPPSELKQMDQELTAVRGKVQKKIIDAHRATLYY